MNIPNVDLNAKAFGNDAAQVVASVASDTSTETPQVEEKVETTQEENGEGTAPETVVEEQKVPYSRFHTMHQRAKEAEQRAEFYRQQAEQGQNQQPQVIQQQNQNEDLPGYWVELYGDSDASKKAYSLEMKRVADIEQRAEAKAIEALQNYELQREQRVTNNLSALDDNVDELAAYIGRDLTSVEESDVLDIVDEFTPKDEHGNYAGELLPFAKAWEIYEMRQAASQAPKQKAKTAIASISATESEGSTETKEKKDDFRPGDWKAWKRNLK